MARRKLVYYPDECLKTPTKPLPVEAFNGALQALIDDMFETMYEENGVGLAAPQIGLSLNLAVMDISENKQEPICLINPTILQAEGSEWMMEGCLSVPGLCEKVLRSKWIKVSALNRKGESFELEGEGLFAQCIQHELDHLNGVLYLDRLSPLKRQRLTERMKKLLKKNKK